MPTGTKYNTKQRAMLIEYMENWPEPHFTVNDVCDFFKKKGSPIGQTTVYRQLDRLVEEGLVNKYTLETGKSACFEYTGISKETHSRSCFHCKCEKCGKLIHMHCEDLESISSHLMAEHNFELDPFRTVFYGICENCRQQ